MSKKSKKKRDKKIRKKAIKVRQKKAALAARYNKTGKIFFDESGNTGSNLLDSSQPVFVLGSHDFTEQEGYSLLNKLRSHQSSELKFSTLRRRRRSGQDAIVSLLSDKRVTPKRLKYSVLHKEFVIVGKIVDDLIENFTSRVGYDLYQGAENVALSNLLFHVIPAFCGQDHFQYFLSKFMAMMKYRNEDTIDSFYNQIENLKTICENEGHNMSSELFLLAATKDIISDIFSTLPGHSNNPAVPALFALSYYWGKYYKKGFQIKHDDAKPVEQQQQILRQFSDINQKTVQFGYGIRRLEIPLKMKKIEFIDSRTNTNIQLADIFTSSMAYWIKYKIGGNTDDYFFKNLEKINFDNFVVNMVWPTTDVTPESLGADPSEFRENPADVVARFLQDSKIKE